MNKLLKLFYQTGKTEARSNQKLPKFQLFISIVGLCVSFWTYIIHIQHSVGAPLVCDINETINCSKVIGSSAGVIFGIPLGIGGLIYWLIVMSLIFLPKYSNVSEKYVSFWRLFVGVVGAVSALILAYVSYFILHGVCEFCSIIQLSCIANFVSTAICYKKSKHNIFYASFRDFTKFAVGVVLSMIIPLVFFVSSEEILASHYERQLENKVAIKNEKTSDAPLIFNPLLDNVQTDYSFGSDDAPVTIVQFTDFECPYCQRLHEKLRSLKSLVDEGKVKIYFRNWPLSYHKFSKKIAIAARCAGEQGKFWEFADWGFESARKFARDIDKKQKLFSSSGIEKKIASLGLDEAKFKSCFNSSRINEKLQKDASDAQALGGKGTPFVFLNGQEYRGNWLKPGQLENDIESLISK